MKSRHEAEACVAPTIQTNFQSTLVSRNAHFSSSISWTAQLSFKFMLEQVAQVKLALGAVAAINELEKCTMTWNPKFWRRRVVRIFDLFLAPVLRLRGVLHQFFAVCAKHYCRFQTELTSNKLEIIVILVRRCSLLQSRSALKEAGIRATE